MELILRGSQAPALYDAVDDPVVSRFRWYHAKVGPAQKSYVFSRINSTTISMHRLIMGLPNGFEIDHIDGNGLNNRRDNLRVCTPSQNRQNSPGWRRRKSPYKGVSLISRWRKVKSKNIWEARICWGGKQMVIGTFDSEESAAQAYDQQARIHHGNFARLNFPKPGEMGVR